MITKERICGSKKYMEQIKPVEKISPANKFLIKLKSLVTSKSIAYGASAAIGAVSGSALQEQSRTATGYDPISHATLKAELVSGKENGKEKSEFEEQKEVKKRAVLERFQSMIGKIKRADPREVIKNSETYKQLKDQFLDLVKYIDDASFWVPALFTFILLGGYLDRKISALQGDPVNKAEMMILREKINEIIGAVEDLQHKIEIGGVASLTPEEVEGLKYIVRRASSTLPEVDDLNTTDK